MKKTYINPRIRVVELECQNGIADLMVNSGPAEEGSDKSRRDRWQDDWDEEDW